MKRGSKKTCINKKITGKKSFPAILLVFLALALSFSVSAKTAYINPAAEHNLSINNTIFIANAGNIGIGNTIPNVTLHVSGATNITGYLEVGKGLNVSNGMNVISGNVGIGTTGPEEKLQVAGAIKVTGGITTPLADTNFYGLNPATDTNLSIDNTISMIQKTYILDTNIYGELLIDEDSKIIIRELKKDNSIYVYGLDVIGHELEDAPITIKFKGEFLRDAVLSIYKTIVNEELKLYPLADYIASEYYKKFTELRESVKYREVISPKIRKFTEKDLRVDFQIIAMASLKEIDVVVSTDKRTMLSGIAEETYNLVNKLNGLRSPRLLKYSDFKKRYVE